MRAMTYIHNPELKKVLQQGFRKAFFDDKIKSYFPQMLWRNCRQRHYPELCQLPKKVSKILTADYDHLIKYYQVCAKIKDPAIIDEIKNIFDYDKYRNIILTFLIQYSQELQISTCHYCEMTYVNLYHLDPLKKRIFYINNASIEHIKNKLGLASSECNQIKSTTINSDADFAKILLTGKKHNLSKQKKMERYTNLFKIAKEQFDIEHVLDKATAPIVALSLYNLTLSCQYCNSRIKGMQTLGQRGAPKVKLSPTSSAYEFDNKVKIHIYPKGKYNIDDMLSNPNDFSVNFDTIDADYKYEIQFFNLQERYQAHIIEGLRIIQLYKQYNEYYFELMSNALNNVYSPSKIEEDMFGELFTENNNRILAKMKRDLINECRYMGVF